MKEVKIETASWLVLVVIYTDDFGIAGHKDAAMKVWKMLQEELKYEEKGSLEAFL